MKKYNYKYVTFKLDDFEFELLQMYLHAVQLKNKYKINRSELIRSILLHKIKRDYREKRI